MSDPQVVIYGASGYTGKLIAWHLAEAGIPFVAAGRNQQRLEEQMAAVPELANAEYTCAAVDNTAESLTELFTGKKIVYNVVGPFMQLGEPVVQAALAAGCHYLDTTGETDWMTHIRDNYGAQFEEKGLVLCPATSWMWTAGNLAAEIALETDGVDSVDIVYLADSDTSQASTKSFLRMCTNPQYYLERNELQMWPYATLYPVQVPDSFKILNALPWSGGAETLWYRHDDRVVNCSTLVAFKNQELLGAIHGILVDFEENHRDKSTEEQGDVTNAIGGQIVTEEPGREDPDINRCVIACIGRGNTVGVRVTLRGNSPYIQTGVLAAEAIGQILAGDHNGAGFQSPAEAFGARRLISVMADRGLHVAEATAL